MRIIGGQHRGRQLKAPGGTQTRPTFDRTRESLFNILEHGLGNDAPIIEGANVLDVFAGSGALGLEALSRGATGITFIERNANAARAIQANAATLGAGSPGADRIVTILKLDATRLAVPPRTAHTPAQIVFLDPPYGEGLFLPALLGLAQKGWLAKGAVVVVEVGAKEEPAFPPAFRLLDQRTYGAAKVSFLKFDG